MCLMIKRTKHHVILESYRVRNKSFTEIEKTAKLLYFVNSSASNLGRSLSAYLDGTQLSFAEIETKVAPTLFLALTTIPQVSQVSYIGLDGLMFSFYNDNDQTLAVYSNTSHSSSWYAKPVNRDTGKLYGNPVALDSMLTVNSSWFQKALNSTSGYSSVRTGWNKAQDTLILNAVAMDGRGVISLGFPITIVTDHFAALDFHGGFLHLGSEDGQVIMKTNLPDTQIDVYNSSAVVQVFKPNGGLMRQDNLLCSSDYGKLRPHTLKILGNKYMFYCSTLDIAGIHSVYVLAYPGYGLADLVHRNSRLSIMLLSIVLVLVIVSLCMYIFLTARATKREMFLCAALIKQTEATQQAERKSMNKTKAYAGANHDVRGSLAAITGLIELCQEDAKPESELAANLMQMQNCTKDLLGILNSILDMSKIEAGKASLEKEDFNLSQLLEDVVDMYYPLGMKKGVDVVLDPCDGSILKLPLVRGDRIKIKQILCNLVSNAIKFTTDGHVSVRAVVKKNNFKKEIIASNRTNALKFLSWFCHRNKNAFTDLDAFHSVEENPNELEIEFEVDDTGRGVPKDKQKSIFEDYVQVKETTIGQEGCGLGLGIVQSLVRVMKGELRIIEKEPGERGTCFRFNVFLSTSGAEFLDTEENRPSSGFHQHFYFMSPKPEGSHVIMFMAGEERRKVLKKYIESLNIKVTIIKHWRGFPFSLEKIKRKLEGCYFSAGKSESNLFEYSSTSASSNSDMNSKPLSIKDGTDHILPQYRNTNSKISSGIILFVIDSNAVSNHADELHSTLANFRKDIPKSLCKVVWLDDRMVRQSGFQEQDRQNPEGDYVIYKPLHGSRLIEVLSLLPERKCSFSNRVIGSTVEEIHTSEDPEQKGASQCSFSKCVMGSTVEGVHLSDDPEHKATSQCSISQCVMESTAQEINTEDLNLLNRSNSSVSHTSSLQQIVIHKQRDNKPLDGKRILVVEDNDLLRRLTATSLCKLGANVERSTNGEEALNQVCKALSDQKKEGDSKSLPYDYIFMDCEMPIMNGYEATRLIRIEEKQYDVHIPIIALTAHAMPEEASKSFDAGMDFHLTKPLQVDKLMDVIQSPHKQ
ncbi:histidine kinase CKI1 [Hevea brasiliensis]|nr:histidine kinase CKI1 [Hevea brasiliensis]